MEELKTFLGSFRNSETEKEFRQYSLNRDKKQSILAIILILIPNVLFIYSDVLLIQQSGQSSNIFYYRLVFTIISVLAIMLINKVKCYTHKDYVILFWWLITIAHIQNINYTRPIDYYYFVIIDLIIILLIYLISASKFIYQFIPAMFFSFADLYLVLFVKEGGNYLTLNVIVVTYIFVNITGFFTGRLLNSNKRWHFLNIIAEKEFNKKLEELNTDKNKFLAVLSHDLRNPFISFQGGLELLALDEFESKEERISYSRKLFYSARRIANLLENILNWSKIHMGSYTSNSVNFNIHDMVDDYKMLYDQRIKEKNLMVKNELNENLFIKSDKNIVELVFRNVFSNAIKFSEKKGEIIIKSQNNEEYLMLLVEDNGVGIPFNVQQDILNVYNDYSTRGTDGEIGTGLGLGISNDFMNSIGGKICLESEVGKGTKVYIQIPTEQKNKSPRNNSG